MPRKINELVTVVPVRGNDKRRYVDTSSDEARRKARELSELAAVYAKAARKLREES